MKKNFAEQLRELNAKPAYTLTQIIQTMEAIEESEASGSEFIIKMKNDFFSGDPEYSDSRRLTDQDFLIDISIPDAGGSVMNVTYNFEKTFDVISRALVSKALETTFGEVWAQSNDELSEEVAKETYLFALGGICLWSQKMLATFFQREIKTKLSTALSDFLEEADYFAVSRLGFVLKDPKTLDRTSKYMRERRNRTKAVKMIGCPIGKRLSEKRYSCTIQTQPGKSIRFFHTLDSSGVK